MKLRYSEKIGAPRRRGVAKVPIIMQMDEDECGAVCLAMVLASYGRWIPMAQMRADCGISRDGSKAENILRAAAGHGMEAELRRMEASELRTEADFPCVIGWERDRFAVLDGFRRGKAVINHPGRGTIALPYEQFTESYGGLCIRMAPGERFEREGAPTRLLTYAAGRLAGSFSAIAFVIIATFAASVAGIIQPVFQRVLTDRLLTGRNPEWLRLFLLLFAFVIVLQLAALILQAVHLLRLKGKMAVTGNASFFWHILHMPMDFFYQRTAGDLQQRQQINADIAETLIDIFAPVFLNAGMMVFYLAVMLRYSPLLSLLGLGATAVNLLLTLWISKKRVNITRQSVQSQGQLSGVTVSGIKMIETIKAIGAENGFFEKWAGYANSLNNVNVGYVELNQFFGIIRNLVMAAANSLVLAAGVFMVMRGHFSVGMIMAFQGFFSAFAAPVNTLMEAGEKLQEMRAQMERVEDVMTYPEDAVVRAQSGRLGADDPRKYRKLSGNIELKHITFGYSKLDGPLIEDFSLTLKQGGSVAFVGASGCGKSTIAKMVAGLYEPWSGEILFDGTPIREIDRDLFVASVSVVDQDITLFEDTIANNIRMWDGSIEDFEVIMAARDARLHEEIMMREGGYQYRIAEGGRDFSGGQRQRMEIARALAQDPTILIMDEATSALDAKTEYDVVRAVRDRGITCIVVAHRLSTIRDCDEIIVLDRGHVAERGTHEELLAADGLYARLVKNE